MVEFYETFEREGLRCYLPANVKVPTVLSRALLNVSGGDAQPGNLVRVMTAILGQRGYKMVCHVRGDKSASGVSTAEEFSALTGTDLWRSGDVALHAASGYMMTDVLIAPEAHEGAIEVLAWGWGAKRILERLLRESGVESTFEIRRISAGEPTGSDSVERELSDIAYCLQEEYGDRFEPLGVAPGITGGIVGGGFLHSVEGFAAEVLGPGTRGAYARVPVRRRRRFSSAWRTFMTPSEGELMLRRHLDAWLRDPPWVRKSR